MTEAQTELPHERDEVVTELRARPADPEIVARAPGPDPGADPDVVGVFDGVRHAVGGAEAEEHADPPVGRASGLQVLVEVIVDAPRVTHLVERLGRDEQPREEALQEPRQDRARIGQAGKLLSRELPRQVGGILPSETRSLVAPPAPRS